MRDRAALHAGATGAASAAPTAATFCAAVARWRAAQRAVRAAERSDIVNDWRAFALLCDTAEASLFQALNAPATAGDAPAVLAFGAALRRFTRSRLQLPFDDFRVQAPDGAFHLAAEMLDALARACARAQKGGIHA
ncbi:hypothetical protein [Xanthobacter sp. KR7-225]|uniref:hypothetical protein n=1 Tax=Xanthobacter sp. KR7-225 TaxID=3156613 RepID=UPI0032B5B305